MRTPARSGPFAAALAALLAVASPIACRGARPPSPRHLPPPTQSTTVGPGDVFTLYIHGEKDLPVEYRVQPDGTVDFPYVKRLTVAGLEPQQITDLVRQRLIDARILSDPQLTLTVKQYNSKRVSVIGQVQKPGNVPWTEGMRLVDAISQSGGFTAIADSNHVVLTRKVAHDKTVTVLISVDAITDGEQSDVMLQAGDTVKVDSRVF